MQWKQTVHELTNILIFEEKEKNEKQCKISQLFVERKRGHFAALENCIFYCK